MMWFNHIEPSKIALGSALVATSAIAVYSVYKLRTITNKQYADNIYESQKSLYEYLVFHYGGPTELCAWPQGPLDALDFPKRCADLCIKYAEHMPSKTSRALDIGCAVGRSSFELTRSFDQVVGIDYSHAFTAACNELKSVGRMSYEVTLVGDLTNRLMATVDPSLDRSKTSFMQGDACNLPSSLGRFDMVLAANLICRLHTPDAFFQTLTSLMNPGGILVITSPYTFLREFTPKENWVGGWVEDGVHRVTGFDGLKMHLSENFDFVAEEDMAFLIRETERKHQWTVAHATVWQLRQ